MKIYPYQTPEGVIELVEKREYDDANEQLHKVRIRCSEWADVAGKHGAEIDKLRAANAELIERLRERTESHLAASARDVQTIQMQSVLLERMANALRAINSLEGDELIPSGDAWSDASVAAFHQSLTALSAYESANLEPVANPIDEAVKRMMTISRAELWKIYTECDSPMSYDCINAVRARLISAAKGES